MLENTRASNNSNCSRWEKVHACLNYRFFSNMILGIDKYGQFHVLG